MIAGKIRSVIFLLVLLALMGKTLPSQGRFLQEKKDEDPSKSYTLWIVIGIIILVGIGIYALAYYFFKKKVERISNKVKGREDENNLSHSFLD